MYLDISNTLDNWANVVTIVVGIFSIISVIIAYLSFIYGKKRKRKEIAIALADEYRKKILPMIDFFEKGMQQSLFKSACVSLIPTNRMEKFNMQELKEIVGDENIKRLKDLMQIDAKNIIFAKIFSTANASEILSLFSLLSELKNDKAKYKNITVALQQEFESNISSLLNTLEWFCMNFNSGIADENIVYQSLHQTFISTVQSLYYFICIQNKEKNSQKYFTNIIKLYNTWNTRNLKITEKEKKWKQNYNKIQEKAIVTARKLS